MMNRPAVGPQSLRGLPTGFPSSQSIPPNRSASSRLPPSGKMSSNGPSWASFGGVPMGSAGLQNPRPNNGPMTSFAQAMGGSSQPATPLDLSEFPSLSNHPSQQSMNSNQSTWATAGARGLGPANNSRLHHSSLSTQQLNAQAQTQQQQEDLFQSSTQVQGGSQGAFRFGSQNAVGQSSQAQPTTTEEFPPLGRNGTGELGQDRASSIMQNAPFGNQGNNLAFVNSKPTQNARSNGLLNALSGNSRATSGNRAASPGSISAVSVSRSPIEPGRQSLGGVAEDEPNGFSNHRYQSGDSLTNQDDGNVSPTQHDLQQRSKPLGSSHENEDGRPEVHDPLADFSEVDKWGLKGVKYMMNNFPDYAALLAGTDFSNIGIDLDDREPISTQIYSLFDNEPARPPVPPFTNPECYRVHNVASVDSKMPNFNDESLLFMFYSNPNDIQQVMAAQELNNRNWRFHKKLQLWLTKDLDMQPQQLSNDSERGYYVFFDWRSWQRERRELTLKYSDLESLPPTGPQ